MKKWQHITTSCISVQPCGLGQPSSSTLPPRPSATAAATASLTWSSGNLTPAPGHQARREAWAACKSQRGASSQQRRRALPGWWWAWRRGARAARPPTRVRHDGLVGQQGHHRVHQLLALGPLERLDRSGHPVPPHPHVPGVAARECGTGSADGAGPEQAPAVALHRGPISHRISQHASTAHLNSTSGMPRVMVSPPMAPNSRTLPPGRTAAATWPVSSPPTQSRAP